MAIRSPGVRSPSRSPRSTPSASRPSWKERAVEGRAFNSFLLDRVDECTLDEELEDITYVVLVDLDGAVHE
jgi:hypothetical protein